MRRHDGDDAARGDSALRRALGVMDRISMWAAKGVALFTLLIMMALLREIVGRYFLNAPTTWANEINQYLLCGLTMFGGAYCVLTDGHIRVDILWRRFSTRTKALVELITSVFPLAFLGVVFWLGVQESAAALVHDQRSMTLLELPLFPPLVTVPLGVGLMLIQLIVRLIRDVLQLISDRAEHRPGVKLFQ